MSRPADCGRSGWCALNTVFPSTNSRTGPTCERLLRHARVAAEYVGRYGFKSLAAALLLNQVGYYLNAQARYGEAEPLCTKARPRH